MPAAEAPMPASWRHDTELPAHSLPAGREPHILCPFLSSFCLSLSLPSSPQVAADFEYCAKAASLTTVCLYGGTQYGPQESMLRRGVDVVIGTPGRVKDHLERRTLDLRCAGFCSRPGGGCWKLLCGLRGPVAARAPTGPAPPVAAAAAAATAAAAAACCRRCHRRHCCCCCCCGTSADQSGV